MGCWKERLGGRDIEREREEGGSCCSGGAEVCLHPCRIHQRAFEQTDSRRTPLSAINQQHTQIPLSLFLPFLLPFFLLPSFSARRRGGVRRWLCTTENMIYRLQTLKVQSGTTLKDEVVFVCLLCCFSVFFFFFYNSPPWKHPRWQFQSTTDISAKNPELWVQRYSENTTGAETTQTCCCCCCPSQHRAVRSVGGDNASNIMKSIKMDIFVFND